MGYIIMITYANYSETEIFILFFFLIIKFRQKENLISSFIFLREITIFLPSQ